MGFVKVPQIYKMLQSQSAEGISPFSVYTGTMIYMQLAGFAMFEGIPFSVYGENLIVLV